MKAIVKISFVLSVVLFLSSLHYPDAITALIAIGTGFALLTGVIVPAGYFNTLNSGINLEVWKKYIIERLRKDNSFLFKSKDDSGKVLGGSVVHIAQAGAKPTVVKNRSSYPAVAVRRTDGDITYVLDSYTTDPTHIPFIELQTIAYDKIDSVLGDHMLTLGEAIADATLIAWSPAIAQSIRTTGASIEAFEGQTGNRKGFHPKDLRRAMTKMNNANVPKAGRIALIDDNMFEFFYDSLTELQANHMEKYVDLKEGIVGRLHGFDIMTRSSVLAYGSTDTVKALDAAIAGDDNLASICWHPSTVCRAIGQTKPFQDKDNPLYYGDIYSMEVRAGGRKERADNLGVIGIVQDAVAA